MLNEPWLDLMRRCSDQYCDNQPICGSCVIRQFPRLVADAYRTCSPWRVSRDEGGVLGEMMSRHLGLRESQCVADPQSALVMCGTMISLMPLVSFERFRRRLLPPPPPSCFSCFPYSASSCSFSVPWWLRLSRVAYRSPPRRGLPPLSPGLDWGSEQPPCCLGCRRGFDLPCHPIRPRASRYRHVPPGVRAPRVQQTPPPPPDGLWSSSSCSFPSCLSLPLHRFRPLVVCAS